MIVAPPLRLGMIFTVDPGDVGAISGLPYAAARALERRGVVVVPLEAATADPPATGVRRRLKGLLPAWVHEWPAQLRSRRDGCVFHPALQAAARIADRIATIDREAPLDALVGMCVSVPLAFLETELPIVYASDATARIILETYPKYARRCAAYRRECDECERRALAKASRIALASDRAVRSAVEDYGARAERVHLVPLGCHVFPDPRLEDATDPPTRDRTTLLIVASDPERKRIGLAIEMVELLRRRGIGAELVHIGARHRLLDARSVRSFVRSLGPLRLSDPQDRAAHVAAIRAAHLSILPSSGEAFGIAPAESALAGRPAIVSDAGGLPTVVADGETGVVLPVAADASAWADAVERLVDDPELYRRLGAHAKARAWREFTWDAWAERVESLARAAVAERIASRPAAPESLRARASA
jgi:glycosyltransferase involved in cell wall biosynthesis